MQNQSNLIRVRVIDNVEYIDKNGNAVQGSLKVALCKPAPKPSACQSIIESSFAYLTYDDNCVPLSMDEVNPPTTKWDYAYTGPRGRGEKSVYDGSNDGIYPYNVDVSFICTDNNETKVNGNYNFNDKKFHVTVFTEYGCSQDIGQMTMVFYHFKFLIMIICMALGVYINYFGVYKVKRTLMFFGFVFTFFFCVFIFAELFHARWLTSF